jgi:hypothetical protein
MTRVDVTGKAGRRSGSSSNVHDVSQNCRDDLNNGIFTLIIYLFIYLFLVYLENVTNSD